MLKKTKTFFSNAILTVLFSGLMLASAQAAKPLWTFVPQTPTNITIAKGGGTQVTYTVQNQSSRHKTLVMKPIAGVSQGAPCQLPAKGVCTLTLNVNGSALQGDVMGGPVLCQQGNDLQCYQPSSTNILRIRLIQQPPVQQFTVTPLAGAEGSISPPTAQVVNAGSSLVFTATSYTDLGVNQWLLDGNVVQNGGTSFQLNNIQANHTVEVTFNQTTLSPLTQSLALSIKSPGSDPELNGNVRIIRIKNTGSIAANNLQVSTSGLPFGTSTRTACTDMLDAGATCDITITPGGEASPDNGANPCTTAPGREPVPAVVTVSADNALSTNVNVLVLGYGCIYQGGFLFSVDDATANTQSIGGKVAALADESSPLYSWAELFDETTAQSITDGASNTSALASPPGQYLAAQACLNKSDQELTNWFMPAICELGRFVVFGADAGCGSTNPNLYTTLHMNGLGDFADDFYWSSSSELYNVAWFQRFGDGLQTQAQKNESFRVRCVRAFTP